MITFFEKPIDTSDEPEDLRLRYNHVGKHISGGYVITEQHPFGCLAVLENCKTAERIVTYKGHELTIGFVDRIFIPLCELETFA